jgi:lysophospholipase L1-like esterase
MSRVPFTLAALGDSITTAFNADGPADNPTLSFATGEAPCGRVRSHLVRVREALPTLDVRALNVAVSGARAAALPEQARRVAASRPDYATILIGANDAPQWLFGGGDLASAATSFAGHVREAIGTLVAANARVMILLLAVPDQSRVLDLALEQDGGDLARLAARLPPSLRTGLAAAYAQRHARLNATLAAVAREFPGPVRFADAIARVRFAATHLSQRDRYHPSVAGQALLAELSWQQGFFP